MKMIRENHEIVEKIIARKCEETGRAREEITLIAVSKTNPPEIIKEAFESGLLHFGENKAQEFREKVELVTEPVFWHFIGHLQSNKVKYVINSAEYIHSVDSIKIAEEINTRAGKIDKVQKILLEINTSSEEAKFGLHDEKDIIQLIQFCKNSEFLNPVGLMTMAPFINDESVVRNCFRNLRLLKEKLNDRGFGLKELSMGMTNDFKIAIEEGATMLRIGSAIFSNRIN